MALQLWPKVLTVHIDFVYTCDLIHLPMKVVEIYELLLIILQNVTQSGTNIKTRGKIAKTKFVSLPKLLATIVGPV